MVITVEDYKEIRRLYLAEGLSQRQIAQRLSISRNTVKKYCEGNNVPWEGMKLMEALCTIDQIAPSSFACPVVITPD